MSELLGIIALLIPFAGITCGCLAIYLNHKKQMAMIAKGMKPTEEKYMPEKLLTFGLVMAGIGAAICIGLYYIAYKAWLIAGLVPGLIGVALILSYLVTKAKKKR